jgi:hypothetical protein
MTIKKMIPIDDWIIFLIISLPYVQFRIFLMPAAFLRQLLTKPQYMKPVMGRQSEIAWRSLLAQFFEFINKIMVIEKNGGKLGWLRYKSIKSGSEILSIRPKLP